MSASIPTIQTIHETTLGRMMSLSSIEDIGNSHSGDFDGVYCGVAKCGKEKVVFILQDYSFKGGSCGKRHGNQIQESIELAIKRKIPLVMFLETGGARVQEGQATMISSTTALHALSTASGYIPTIAVIMGTCAGLGAYFSSICDCCVFIEGKSQVFMTGPKVVSTAIGKRISKEDLGGAHIHAIKTGIPTHLVKDIEEAQDTVAHLIDLMPNCYEDNRKIGHIPVPRRNKEKSAVCGNILPANNRSTYDMYRLIDAIVDEGSYSDFFPKFARNLITGLASMNGQTIGIVANQPKILSGAMDVKSAAKFTRFIQICDAFNIPLVFLVDCPGFIPGVEQESTGSVNFGGKASHMLRSCLTTKVTVIIRRIIGGAYAVMNSVSIGADYTLAWPSAEIAIMGKEAAGQVSAANTLDDLDHAVSLGIVNEVVEPGETRRAIVKAINEVNKRKKVVSPAKRRIVLPM